MSSADNQKPSPPWDSLLTNVRIATMADPASFGIIEGGALAIHEGRVAWVGPGKDLPGEARTIAGNVIDCNGTWITPGLIDCHTQLVYGGHETKLDKVIAATEAAPEAALIGDASRRLISLMEEGVTTVDISSGFASTKEGELKLLRAARKLEDIWPVHVYTTLQTPHFLPPEFNGDKTPFIEKLKKTFTLMAKEKLADAVLIEGGGIEFLHTELDALCDAAIAAKLLLRVQARQLAGEEGHNRAHRVKPLTASQLEYATEESIRVMSQTGVVAVLLPAAYYSGLGASNPLVPLLQEYKVPMAVATGHNPIGSPCNSLLLAMHMGCHLLALTPLEALHGTTSIAARALGIDAHTGTLEIGKIADIVFWDITHPRDLTAQLGHNPCLGVLKNGVLRRAHG